MMKWSCSVLLASVVAQHDGGHHHDKHHHDWPHPNGTHWPWSLDNDTHDHHWPHHPRGPNGTHHDWHHDNATHHDWPHDFIPGQTHKDKDGPHLRGNPSVHFNDALALIEGLSDGLFGDETLSNCIGQAAENVPSFKSSIEELTKALRPFKPLQIAKAVKHVRSAMEDIQQELQQCGANVQNLKGLLAALKETVPAIIGEISSAKESLDQKNYEEFGEHVGHALALFVSKEHPTSAVHTEPTSAASTALQFIVGFLDGMYGDHPVSECIASALEKSGETKSALDDLTSAINSKNPFKMVKAFKELKQAMDGIPGALKPCGDHAEALETSLKLLLKNGSEFVDDNLHAFQSLQAHDLGNFGLYIGKAMRIIAHGTEPDAASVVVV